MKLFTQHPAEHGETYGAHLRFTLWLAMQFWVLSLAVLIHGLLPFLLSRFTSDRIAHLNRVLDARCQAKRDTPPS